MQSIRARLVGSYLIVILVTVSVLVGFLIFGIRQYYMQNVTETLIKQAEISADFYNRYLADPHLENQARELLENFSANSSAQVQILDSKGKLLEDFDSSAATGGNMAQFSDVQSALQGKKGQWQGSMQSTKEPILSAAYPLLFENEVVGVVRFITSLTEVNRVLRNISFTLILMGFIVVTLAFLVSWALSRTIIGPVNELTNVAAQMAKGKFSTRANKKYNDELGKLADTLNFMASEIIKNDQLKNDFISSVSHELRTPLTSIKGWVVTLRHGKSHDP